jgi:uncharacterized membrane protein
MTKQETTESLGPVEFIVLRFKGNKFTGDITPALVDLVDKGLIRIIDLAIVMKDGKGDVAILERQELSADVATAMVKLGGAITGLLSEADLMEEAEALEPNQTAAAVLVEHIWAKALASAVRAANGEIVLSERIPHAVVAEARATLIAAAG